MTEAKKMGKKSAGIALAALSLFAAVLAFGAEERRMTPDELRGMQLTQTPGLAIIDVRPPTDFEKRHIQGARNAPSAAVQTAGLDRSGTIVVYCGEDPCPLTSGAARRLTSDGYSSVSILAGGLPAWIAKGYPVESGLGQPAAQARRTDLVSVAEAKTKLDAGTALAVDVRSPEEFHAGHLPGAVSLPLEALDTASARLPKDKELIVYDRQADRSRKAQQKLATAGFKTRELLGGIAGWVKRRMPLEVK
jgi:rhodanese-related sulfurtransferase